MATDLATATDPFGRRAGQDREQFKVCARASRSTCCSRCSTGCWHWPSSSRSGHREHPRAVGRSNAAGRSACSAQSECSGPRCAARSTSNRCSSRCSVRCGRAARCRVRLGLRTHSRRPGANQISVPWGQVLAMLIGSGVVGVLAALWPASRAARDEAVGGDLRHVGGRAPAGTADGTFAASAAKVPFSREQPAGDR